MLCEDFPMGLTNSQPSPMLIGNRDTYPKPQITYKLLSLATLSDGAPLVWAMDRLQNQARNA